MQKAARKTRLTAELLAMPAPHSVRAIALARLEELRANYERFLDGDEEGLHDLRVSLRRLRSWLRAFRPEVDDTLRKKMRRGLSDLADATNGARDAEVGLAWIDAQENLPERARAGRRSIVATLEQERDAATRDVSDVLARDLPKLARKLEQQLEMYWERQRLDRSSSIRTMAPVVAEVVRDHTRRTVRAFRRIESVDDAILIHRARIAAKRLRYLLEPLDGHPAASALLDDLREHQQLLGDVHDAHRLVTRFVREIGERAARDARLRALAALDLGDDAREKPAFVDVLPGMMELTRRAHAFERQAFNGFAKAVKGNKLAEFESRADEIASSLAW